MGVKEDVVLIKQELEKIKKDSNNETKRCQELIKIKRANRKLQEMLILTIFAFIFLLIYTIITRC